MARLSSTSSGTDITVEPKLISRPVGEMTDDELRLEIERLRGERGVAMASAGRKSGPRAQPDQNLGNVEEIG